MEISKNYDAKSTEEKIFDLWMKNNCFHKEPDSKKQSFCIVIPPPNVTGVLHMGHALNNTIQDVLTRKARMDGFNTKWVVGTDHAGIATQNVVEKKIKREKNLSRHDLGRNNFLKEVWDWKEKHGSTIISQLKKMGCSCDYSEERFTMDEGLAYAVKKAFVELYDKNLIYRGDRIIHWCPRCHTALSDEEAEHNEVEGFLYTIFYKIKGTNNYISLATTRPETLLGDTAVAVNPNDERYRDLIGKSVVVPFVNREIPIIADDFVDPSFGTGMVKVTPAHDPNDYEMGIRHNLTCINVMDISGVMNEDAGIYKGMDRFLCRKKICEDLKELNELGEIKKHNMSIRRCYRCDTVIEPRISKQWFVKMKPLADKALEFFKNGEPKFYPKKFEVIYEKWLLGIRDWCISRQIWWGHQIPVWYCNECNEMTVSLEENLKECTKCKSKNISQDEDVLDTWFSSWLWPFSTLGWPQKTKELEYFFPTQILATAQEIIFFWVARMVMSSLEFMKKVPFEYVYIHGTVRDETGLKMSKSYGNVIDPLKIINEYGADALRFSLMVIASGGNDIYISDKKFEIGRNFATKIWNAFRFIILNLEDKKINKDDYLKFKNTFSNDDKLILRKKDEMIVEVDKAIKAFRFNDAALCIYDFFRTHYCDRYIESVKIYFKSDDENKERSICILLNVLIDFLKCLHPFMPFISEELWQIIRSIDSSIEPVLCEALYPKINELLPPDKNSLYTEHKYDFIKSARNLRNRFNISQSLPVTYFIKTDSEKIDFFEEEKKSLIVLLRAKDIKVSNNDKEYSKMPSEITNLGTVFMELDESYIDYKSEREKISLKISEINEFVKKTKEKLSNEIFISKAKPEIIEKEKDKLQKSEYELVQLNENLKFFSENL